MPLYKLAIPFIHYFDTSPLLLGLISLSALNNQPQIEDVDEEKRKAQSPAHPRASVSPGPYC
jgi:hypothetical protein